MAKLDSALKSAMISDPNLLTNWALARDWSEEMRYHRIGQAESEAIFTAIADAAHGVLAWIKSHW